MMMNKNLIAALSAGAMTLILGSNAAQAAPVDITTLPGYGFADSASFNFGPYGWAGWSVPAGKVVLGAQIITGDPFSEFSVFRPAGPGEAFPHYTFGASEYGWVIRNALNGANSGVQMRVFYADPLPGYTITQSSLLNYGSTGWGGWSAPAGDVVSGGGYQFLVEGLAPVSSQLAVEGTAWPHYTFGANEQGWVVQNGVTGGQARVYVVSFDAPVSVPEPSTIALFAMALLSLFGLGLMRRRADARTAWF